jgi:hypothetical protein
VTAFDYSLLLPGTDVGSAAGFGIPIAFFPLISTLAESAEAPSADCPFAASGTECFTSQFSLFTAVPYCTATPPDPSRASNPSQGGCASGQYQLAAYLRLGFTSGSTINVPPPAPSVWNILGNLANALGGVTAALDGVVSGDPLAIASGVFTTAGAVEAAFNGSSGNSGQPAKPLNWLALNQIEYVDQNGGSFTAASTNAYENVANGPFDVIYLDPIQPHVFAIAFSQNSSQVNLPNNFTLHIGTAANDVPPQTDPSLTNSTRSCPGGWVIALFQDSDYLDCIFTGSNSSSTCRIGRGTPSPNA